MKILCWVVLLLGFGVAGVDGVPLSGEAAQVLRLFEERDLLALQRLRNAEVEALAASERNAVALAAAKALTLAPYARALGGQSPHRRFTQPEARDSPAEAECRRQWGINMRAAELLRHLAERRLIGEARVLPHLIGALDHPDRQFVGRDSFYALQHLTRRSSGAAYWGRGVPDAARHRKITRWWREWWEKNRSQRPVFDPELEAAARGEVFRLSRLIETRVKPQFPELALFQAPEELPLRWQGPLFYVEYNPALSAVPVGPGLDPKRLPWVLVSCRFRTEELPDREPRDPEPAPPARLRGSVRSCYSRVPPGSDLVVEVKVASGDPALVSAVQSALRE